MKNLLVENFATEINSSTPTIVDFWAGWCGPCKQFAPTFEALEKEYEGKVNFAKVDVQEQDALIAQLNIKSIPTVILFKDGSEVVRLVGNQTAEKLKEILPQE